MNDSRLTSIIQLKKFLKGAERLDLSLRETSINDKYQFIDQAIDRLDYNQLNRKEKRIVYQYLRKITGYRKAQLYRLIKRAQQGELKRKQYVRRSPNRRYSPYDIKLLEKTDELHLRLSEKATKEILRREYEIFKKQKYQNIKKISHSHITNLRQSDSYKNIWINHTQAGQALIGVTMEPQNYGKPGSIRVDTVHQRDIYHINSIDEITQWEIGICVPQICERGMIPTFQAILDQYPFTVFNFHSDRGSENINYRVCQLLKKASIKQTKSRARKPNDNALIETKNGSIIRKNMGWTHINQSFCDQINTYYKNYFNLYLNYHRPCGYPTTIINKKGRKEKAYDDYQVPYEFLKTLPKSKTYLKPGLSFTKLDKIAYEMSDNDFAQILRKEERLLFNKIERHNRKGS